MRLPWLISEGYVLDSEGDSLAAFDAVAGVLPNTKQVIEGYVCEVSNSLSL